jgi:predicted metalloprotease with PDZ domain
VATTLPGGETSAAGFGRYHAASYDELIDHPVEMSDFVLASFAAGGAAHEIAITGRQRADLDRLARDLARICQWQCDLFGGEKGSPAPFARYLFQVAAVGDGYGGLEHRTSTSLLCKRSELPQPGVTRITDDYRRFLGLASHEYFHAWQVKRIKPEAFTPYDLVRENYTRQLWAFEGITSYYDDLALARSGVIDAASFLELVGRTITMVLRNPGRHLQSVAESSFDAWIKYYRKDENTPNAVVSYYAKGSLVALTLDLMLRQHGSSLDALMRALWRRFGQTGIGVPEDGIAQLAGELAGGTLDEFFCRYVAGTEDPPLVTLLAHFGVTLNLRTADDAGDRGGGPGKRAAGIGAGGGTRASLGAAIAAGTDATLQHVYTGGAAERAGLAAADVVIAIDSLRVTGSSIEAMIEHRPPGAKLQIHAFRRDELFTTTLTLDAAPLDTCWLTLASDAPPEMLARRAAWLGPE